MTQPKTISKKFKTPAEYLSTLSGKTKTYVNQLRKIIKEEAPDAEEVISYNIGGFRLNSMLIWYAGWKEHVSLYPKSKAMEESIKELANYPGNKGTVKFSLDRPLPVGIIRRMVKFRLKEDRAKVKKL